MPLQELNVGEPKRDREVDFLDSAEPRVDQSFLRPGIKGPWTGIRECIDHRCHGAAHIRRSPAIRPQAMPKQCTLTFPSCCQAFVVSEEMPLFCHPSRFIPRVSTD